MADLTQRNELATGLQNLDYPVATFNATTDEQRKIIFNGLDNPDHKLSEFINKQIKVMDFHVERTENIDDETGELQEGARITLFDTAGKSYTATSIGVLTSLRNIVSVFGTPSEWPDHYMTVEVLQVELKSGNRMFKLRVI